MSHWVILGHGRITRGPGPHSNRIDIIAAPLKDGATNIGATYVPGMLVADHVTTSAVPVALLGFFGIGDIWADRFPIGALAFESRSLRLTYSANQFKFASAGRQRSVEEKVRWLIPPEALPLGRMVPNAQLLAIAHGRYPYGVLIPSTVILRFYYGGSSELYRALFSPGFGQPNNPAFDPALTLVRGDELHLHLRPGIQLSDARIIAPWVDTYGLRQVANLYESTLVPRGGETGYLRAKPPFEGAEELEAEGLTIAAGTEFERFLVLRIRRGTLPVPYRRIVIANPEHSERTTENADGETAEVPPPRDPRQGKGKSQTEIETGVLPGTGRRMSLALPSAERFRDAPQVERIRRTAQPKPKQPAGGSSVGMPTAPTTPQVGAAGDGGTGSVTKVVVSPDDPVATASDDSTLRPRSLAFASFHDDLEALDSRLEQPHDIIVLDGLVPEDRDPGASVFPAKHNGADAYHGWYYRQRSRIRRRKLLVASARYRGAWFSLLEPEQKPHEKFQLAVALTGVAPPPDTSLVALAGAAALENCIWPEGLVNGMDVRRQKHTWETPEEFVATLTGLFDSMLGY